MLCMCVVADGRITELQQRPLPKPPVSTKRLINHFSLHYDKDQKPLGQVGSWNIYMYGVGQKQ